MDVIDRLYTHLRRCGGTRWPEPGSDAAPKLCDGTPYTEHKARGPHDCTARKCKPHVCKPMEPSTIRRIHGILSPALNYAVSWGWIERNPAEYAHPPKVGQRKARPHEPEQVVQVLNQAAAEDLELFVFLWTAVTTGARRGEVVALRWPDVERERARLVLATSYVVRNGQRRLKPTKTDEERRLSLDTVTLQLLADFRAAREAALALAHLELPADAFVFSPDPLGSRPWHPDHFTHAYRDVATPLGVEKPLKNLRHFNATQLLAAGVDLSTVAARLGHADGGATTLRVYASWTQPADRAAAEQLAGDLDAMRRKAEAAKGLASAPRPLARVARPVEEVLPGAQPAKTYLDVVAALREAIATGRLQSGDFVPTVTELATRFGVARSTAQRAVSLLGGEHSVIRIGSRWAIAAATHHHE